MLAKESTQMDILELQQSVKHLKVLYVEDDPTINQQFAAFLKEFFEHVDSAYNGQEGLEKFSQNTYDVVITDIQMPKLNGWDMLESMHGLKSEVFYCVLSATDLEIPLHSHYDVIMPKPMTLEGLFSMVELIRKKYNI